MRILNRKEYVSVHNQLLVEGEIVLKEDISMINSANDGKEMLSKAVIEPVRILVKAGTRVEYSVQETRTGWYHKVIFTGPLGIFYAKKRTDTFEGRKYAE